MRTPHALVIGKFYPPHAGHHLLVDSALAVADRVTVVVAGHRVESIPVADRARWLREVHPAATVLGVVDDHPVDYDDPAVWDLHVAVFLAALGGERPTAVVSSEAYGAELARRLGAVELRLDVGRGFVPTSGTAVRADPVAAWEHLSAPVRGALAQRVVVVGAESTGTTTLSRDLVDALRARGGAHGLTRWVPEVGRAATVQELARERLLAQLEGRPEPAVADLPWPTSAFVDIAHRQDAAEDAEARVGGPVLVCDTDAWATGLWHERYRGARSAEVDALARHHPLYLLTAAEDVPFEQDGIRDGEHVRTWMQERFVQELTTSGRRWVRLVGTRAGRLAQALAAVDELLADGWGLADPVTPPGTSRTP